MKKMNSMKNMKNMKKQLKKMKIDKFMTEFAHDILDIAGAGVAKMSKGMNRKSMSKKYKNMMKMMKKK